MESILSSSSTAAAVATSRCSFSFSLSPFQLPLRRNRRCSPRSNASVVLVQAAKLPAGVEPPKEEPNLPSALWGFTENAERWNSRAAMIGIFGFLFFELIIKKGFLEVIGFEIGKGLDIPL